MTKVIWISLLCFMFVFNVYGQERSEISIATEYLKTPLGGYSKPGAKISLENRQVNLELANNPYAIDIRFFNGYKNAEMTLDVMASAGLSIIAGELNPVITLNKGIIILPYTVMAAEAGRYYIYANAVITQNEKMFGRALTFVVQVGEEAEVSVSVQKSSAASSGVFSMPAKEEVK